MADQVKSQAIGQETIDIRDAFYPELTPEAVRSMLASYGEWPIDPSDLGQMLLRSGFRVRAPRRLRSRGNLSLPCCRGHDSDPDK